MQHRQPVAGATRLSVFYIKYVNGQGVPKPPPVSQLKRYEKGTSQPTLDVFRKIVLSLSVSADDLLFDEVRGPDDDLRFHFEAVSKLDSDEKKLVKELIEGVLLKHDAKRWTKTA